MVGVGRRGSSSSRKRRERASHGTVGGQNMKPKEEDITFWAVLSLAPVMSTNCLTAAFWTLVRGGILDTDVGPAMETVWCVTMLLVLLKY